MTIKILVVEDNDVVSKLMCIILQQAGFVVDVANTGGSALKLYTTNSYDFIFMDIGLPDCNGNIVANCIRRLSAREKHIPIVALTAHCDDKTREACLSAGMNDFLVKPVDLKLLIAVVTKYATTSHP